MVRMVLGNGFIADTGILICLSGLSKVFLRNDFIGEKFFHPFILFSGCFVSDARSLYGVAVRHILGRKHHEGSTFADTHALYDFSVKRNDTCHGSYGNAFVALCGHNLPAGFNHLIENARFDGAYGYSGSLRFGRGQYDFVAMCGNGFLTVVVSVVMVVAGTFVFMVVPFVVMSRMGVFFRFVIVSFTGLAVAGA